MIILCSFSFFLEIFQNIKNYYVIKQMLKFKKLKYVIHKIIKSCVLSHSAMSNSLQPYEL